jgi:hypothetical protein
MDDIQASSYLRAREKETSMMNIVSLKKIGNPAVAKIAGFFAFAALAMAFFAAPLGTEAMGGGGCGIKSQNATFVGLASDVVFKDPTQQTTSQIVTFTPAKNGPVGEGDWIVVRFNKDNTLWAASISGTIAGGNAKGLTVNDTNQVLGAKKIKAVAGTPLKISGIPTAFNSALVEKTLLTPPPPPTVAAPKGVSTGWMN